MSVSSSQSTFLASKRVKFDHQFHCTSLGTLVFKSVQKKRVDFNSLSRESRDIQRSGHSHS